VKHALDLDPKNHFYWAWEDRKGAGGGGGLEPDGLIEEAVGRAGVVMVVMVVVMVVVMMGEMMLSAHLTAGGRSSSLKCGGRVGGNGRGWCDRSPAWACRGCSGQGTGGSLKRGKVAAAKFAAGIGHRADVSGNFNAWVWIGDDVNIDVEKDVGVDVDVEGDVVVDVDVDVEDVSCCWSSSTWSGSALTMGRCLRARPT
jgi:hypothetical protein